VKIDADTPSHGVKLAGMYEVELHPVKYVQGVLRGHGPHGPRPSSADSRLSSEE
jgi:hypothetical protein